MKVEPLEDEIAVEEEQIEGIKPFSPPSETPTLGDVSCFKCGQEGHWASSCTVEHVLPITDLPSLSPPTPAVAGSCSRKTSRSHNKIRVIADAPELTGVEEEEIIYV